MFHPPLIPQHQFVQFLDGPCSIFNGNGTDGLTNGEWLALQRLERIPYCEPDAFHVAHALPEASITLRTAVDTASADPEPEQVIIGQLGQCGPGIVYGC